ncbi:MAG: MBL fold metallo-hydrolase [Candidatus Poseidoniaceae archaeon]
MVLVELLGSGNAFLPSGRLHSFLAIDKHIVVDCPPTALASLRKAGISPADIDTILITHVHGDHVFGFPFFLLERKYISDREGLKELTVAGSSGVKERLTHLCNLAYPGSLEEILETINWVDVPNVEGWTMERFEVLHDPEVDPHGWMMTNDEGWSMIHSGDSGPFEDLWNRIGKCSFAVVEMGVPEWVNTEHHHKPSDITKLANKYPNTKMVITHTFIDSDYQIITKEVPEFPPNVIHGEDGMEFEINSDGQVL